MGESLAEGPDVRVAAPGWDGALGGDAAGFVQRVTLAAAAAESADPGAAVLLTDDSEMQSLNRAWRDKDQPTNVLSFPAPSQAGYPGDIVLSLGVITGEAKAQGKPFAAHAAHLLVHGFLHLLGYDHDGDEQAERMEARERAILAGLGHPDPYASD